MCECGTSINESRVLSTIINIHMAINTMRALVEASDPAVRGGSLPVDSISGVPWRDTSAENG